MERNAHLNSITQPLRHVASHASVTILAVGIAFSLPILANYILFTWWPMVAEDSQLLLINEVAFAAILVLLFNLLLKAREARRSHHMTSLLSLVHVCHEGSRLLRKAGRELLDRISGTRDISVMSVTGYDVFVSEMRNLRRVIEDSYELRVLLLNPHGPGAQRRVQSLPDPAAALAQYRRETEATVARLASLAAAGKKVTLKFYDDVPFWNILVTGEHVWVQYCHDGQEMKSQPEYVFSLNRHHPSHGLFPAFYMHFLNNWSDPSHPEYDFSTRQLVHRNARGNEIKREPFQTRQGDGSVPILLRFAS